MLCKIYAIFVRQLFLFKGNPVRLVAIFLWPLLDIVMWGFINRYLSTFGQATFTFANVILGAIILWDFFSRIMHGLMTGFLEDVWTQNFVNFFASPLRLKEYVAGLVVTGLTTGVAAFLINALFAGLAFGYDIFRVGLAVLPFLVVLLIFGIALGLLMTAIILRFGPAAEWLGWPIPFALSVFAGVFYPVATLPASLQIVAKAIPPSYVFESLRGIVNGDPTAPLLNNFLIGAGLALLYLVAMSLFLFMVYRRNLKNGQLARFSAE